MYDHILFDLDGTLTDPFLGITNSIIYSLQKMNIEAPENEALVSFIGPPLKDSYISEYQMTESDALMAIEKYREYFRTKGLFENEVYDGIREMLETLQSNGKSLYVATSKPVVFADEIIKHFELEPYFKAVAGSELDGTRSAKSEVIESLMEQFNLPSNRTVMVGDRKHDIIGAQTHHIDAIGVTFGYGSYEELEAAKPFAIVKTVEDLKNLLLIS